jgi:hypothetical protein
MFVVMKLLENTAILVAGSILMIGVLGAVAVLFIFAGITVAGRRLSPRRFLTDGGY